MKHMKNLKKLSKPTDMSMNDCIIKFEQLHQAAKSRKLEVQKC